MDSDINPYLEMHNAPAENMHYEQPLKIQIGKYRWQPTTNKNQNRNKPQDSCIVLLIQCYSWHFIYTGKKIKEQFPLTKLQVSGIFP